MAADFLLDAANRTQETIGPVLDRPRCETDDVLRDCMIAWGALFKQYQVLARCIHGAYIALGIDPWSRYKYREWRERDAVLLDALRHAEHMEGCNHLAVKIKEAGWGEEYRPAQPSA